MEKVYRIKSGDLINIRTKFTEFKNELRPNSIEELPKTYEDVKAILDIQNSVEEELLEDSISLNNLAQPDDIPISDVDLHNIHSKQGQQTVEIPKKAMRFRCIRNKIEEEASKSHSTMPKKYNRYRFIEQKLDNLDNSRDLVPFEEVLITVRVYEPFIYKRGKGSQRKPRFSQEFVVLGRQRLTELRDKIYCNCNFGPFKEISNDYESIKNTESNEAQETATVSKDPGFFFITDTFYNDNRISDVDYSAEISEWMARQPDIGPVQKKSMHDTKFEDLNVRVGFPQVYRHQVNCEHVISFSDIRLIAEDDSLKSSDYPLLRCVSNAKMTQCMICGISEAAFVVKKSTVHILDPTFMCRNCFISCHYIDGQKIGSFQAYRYYSNRPIIH